MRSGNKNFGPPKAEKIKGQKGKKKKKKKKKVKNLELLKYARQDSNLRPPVLGNRCSENSSLAKTNTYESAETQLTPQLTPEIQKQGKIDTQKLPPDLAEIVPVWPELPEHIKAAIKALVQIHIKGD